MKINIDKYRANIPWIIKIFEKEKNKNTFDRAKICTDISVSSHIPLIAILYFYGEMYGFDQNLTDQINLIEKFYGYTQIDGKKQD